jgi:hypothetical protein
LASLALLAALSPIAGEHRVDDDVFEAVAVPLRLSQNTFFDEAEALRDGSAAEVSDRYSDLDAIEPPELERVRREGADGCRHRASALPILGQPVSDARRSVVPIDAAEPNCADD